LPPALFARARSDPAARDLLRASAGAVVQALANVRALADLRLAVVGGGVGLADGYLPLLRQAMEALPPLFAMTIVPARLGADASLIGVADLAAAG
jgi:predicted NBD/HSP70 family sugar kinase